MTPGVEQGSELRKWLKSWRHQNRMSQAALAEALGYDTNYIAKIEGGTRPASRQFLARLAQVAGTPEEALVHASSTDLSRPPLPCPPDALVGRDQELEALQSLLAGPTRLVTLVGPPGIGKTRLALELATRLDSVLLSGSWWVSLLDVAHAADVAPRACREMGLPVEPGADPAELLARRLRGQQVLVVFDNFEHVLEARDLVSTLAGEVAGVKLLVTSREALGLVSEHVYPVPKLGLPDLWSGPSLAEISRGTAVELFVARATMADPRFRLTEDNCEAVARTCRKVDGLPLAIVLAAGGVATEGTAAIAERASEPLDLADDVPADLPSHHQSLAGAIAASWELLERDEADLLDRLSVFSGGFTAEAAAAVAGAAIGADRRATTRLLASLARKSVVELWGEDRDVPRFDLLASIRSFADARLADRGQRTATRRLHARYYVALSDRCGAGLTGHRQSECAQELSIELDNLRTGFEWALEHEPDLALEMAGNSWRFHLMRDIPTGRQWLARALAASPRPSHARAVACAGAGALAWVTGHFDESRAYLDEAEALAGELDLPAVAAIAWLNRGALAEQLSHLEEADHCFMEAQAIYDRLNDARGRAQALIGRGMICRRRLALEPAYEHWTEAARLLGQVGDRFNKALTLGNLAWAAEHEGQFEEAQDWLVECRRAQIAMGDARGLATTNAGLGRVAYKRGALESAEALTIEALASYDQLGDRPWCAATLVTLAAVTARLGRWRPALRMIGAADTLWSEMGTRPSGEHDDLRRDVIAHCDQHVTDGEKARSMSAGRAMEVTEVLEMVRRSQAGDGAGPPARLSHLRP